MKRVILIICSILLYSCIRIERPEPFFFVIIDNQLSTDIKVELYFSKIAINEDGAFFSKTYFVPDKEMYNHILYESFSSYGYGNVSAYIDSMFIYIADTLIYRQRPIIDSLWRTDMTTYISSYWPEYNFTFIVNDSLFYERN